MGRHCEGCDGSQAPERALCPGLPLPPEVAAVVAAARHLMRDGFHYRRDVGDVCVSAEDWTPLRDALAALERHGGG